MGVALALLSVSVILPDVAGSAASSMLAIVTVEVSLSAISRDWGPAVKVSAPPKLFDNAVSVMLKASVPSTRASSVTGTDMF